MTPKLTIHKLIKGRPGLVGDAVRAHGDTADTRLVVYRTIERIVALTLGRVCWEEVYQRMLEDGGEHSTWERCERLEMEVGYDASMQS